MKNGLSYFDKGGVAESTSTPEVQVTAAKSRSGVTPTGKLGLDPTETESILANMQALIDKRTSPMSTFLGGLQEASAWGAGGEQGPSAALTAVRRQRQLEEADTLGMQEKMAAYRAAQAKAERDAQQVSRFMGGPGTGGGTGGVPNLSQEAMDRLKLTTDPAEQKAIISEDLKTRAGERAKAEFNPAAMKAEEYVYIRNPDTGEIEVKQVSLQGYLDLKAKGLIVPESELYKGGSKPTTAPAAGATSTATKPAQGVVSKNFSNEEIDRLINTESSNKPYAINKETKAMGYGQFMPETLAMLHQKGYKFDPFDRDQTRAAIGNYLDDLVSKTGSKEKALGAYGGFITKDPTAYVNKILQPSDVVKPATTTAAKQIPDIAKIKAEKEVASAFQKEQAQISAQATKKEIEGFKSATEPGSVNNQLYLAKRLGEITTKYKDNPRIVGLLNNADMTSAVAGLLVDGLNTPVGSLSFKGLENAIQKTMPGTTKDEINARQELTQILKSYALEASKVGQGQGAMSDFERQMFEQIAGSTSNSMEMLRRVQKVMEARANFNEKIGRAFEDSYESGKPQDFQQFKKSEAYRTAVKEHRDALLGITKDLQADPSRGEQNKAAGTPKWSHTEDEYTKWKKSKGIK